MDVTGIPVLVARDLYRFFHAGDDETLALRGVSLTVAAGEMVAVTGPSGSGKSTLLACLAGIDDPDGGTVHIAGERVSRRSEQERTALRSRGVGMLFQNGNLVHHLTVAQNVALARRLARRRNRGDDDRSRFARLGIDHRRGAYPDELSGGETARAGLAVALANDPPLVLADEPTAELDRESGRGVLALLRDAAASGAAVVVVTHDREVATAAHRVIELRDGQVV